MHLTKIMVSCLSTSSKLHGKCQFTLCLMLRRLHGWQVSGSSPAYNTTQNMIPCSTAVAIVCAKVEHKVHTYIKSLLDNLWAAMAIVKPGCWEKTLLRLQHLHLAVLSNVYWHTQVNMTPNSIINLQLRAAIHPSVLSACLKTTVYHPTNRQKKRHMNYHLVHWKVHHKIGFVVELHHYNIFSKPLIASCLSIK